MMRITKGTVHLFTFKEGMLSAMAHDLRLTVRRFRVQVDGAAVSAEFFPEAIVVDGAMRGGKLDERALSDRDKDKIRATMAGEVLRTSQHGKITFTGTVSAEGEQLVARGDLTLVGKTRSIEVPMRREGDRVSGTIELRPTEWGIRPYQALGGALKLKDIVRVEFAVGGD